MFKDELIEELKDIQKRYEEELSRVLSKIPFAENEHITSSGIVVKPLYSPGDIAACPGMG